MPQVAWPLVLHWLLASQQPAGQLVAVQTQMWSLLHSWPESQSAFVQQEPVGMHAPLQHLVSPVQQIEPLAVGQMLLLSQQLPPTQVVEPVQHVWLPSAPQRSALAQQVPPMHVLPEQQSDVSSQGLPAVLQPGSQKPPTQKPEQQSVLALQVEPVSPLQAPSQQTSPLPQVWPFWLESATQA